MQGIVFGFIAALAWGAVILDVNCAATKNAAKSCGADLSLLGEVAGDLATPDFTHRLEALVARVGLCTVNRTVEAAITPTGARADAGIVEHGRAWLAAHPLAALRRDSDRRLAMIYGRIWRRLNLTPSPYIPARANC